MRYANKLKVISEALSDIIFHQKQMEAWWIQDDRFARIFAYLTHFYKYKFVSLTTEKFINKFLNNYNDNNFYGSGSSIILKSFFEFLTIELSMLDKIKSSKIFGPVYLEIVRKLMVMFLKQFYAVINHPNFELGMIRINSLLTEFSTFDKLWAAFSSQIIQIYGFEGKIFNWCVRLPVLNKIVDEICSLLLGKILSNIRSILITTTYSQEIEKFDINALVAMIKEKITEIGEINQHSYGRFTQAKYDMILEILTNKLLVKTVSDVENFIVKLRDSVLEHISKVKTVKLDDQIIYIDQIAIFFISNDLTKCQAALSAIQQLLSFKFSKQMNIDLIQKKNYSKKPKLEDYLMQTITSHYEQLEQFLKKVEHRKNIEKKIVTFFNVILFVIRIRLNKTSNSRYQKVIRMNTTENPPKVPQEDSNINMRSIEINKAISVKFQVLTNKYIKERFKGSPINEL